MNLRCRLGLFLILAFGSTWLLRFVPQYVASQGWYRFPGWVDVVTTIAFYGPTLAALIVATCEGGLQGLKTFLRSALRWRVSIVWYAIAILAPLGITVAALGLHVLLGGALPAFTLLRSQWPLLPLLLLQNLLFSGAGAEELGWRGWLQPELQKRWAAGRYGALWTTLVVGFIWGLWYAPNLAIPGSESYALFGPSLIPLYILIEMGWAFLITWVYNRTHGSALVSGLLIHAALNLWMPLFVLDAGPLHLAVAMDRQVVLLLCGLAWLVGLGLLIITRGTLGLQPATSPSEPTIASPAKAALQ